MIAGFLTSAGVECEVRGEHLMGAYGELPMTFDTLPSIWLDPGSRAHARRLIEQALHGGSPGASWTCPGCDEVIEAQFTECWSCGAPKPVVVPVQGTPPVPEA